MLLDLNAYSWPVFKKEINKLAVLALPMLVAQVAQVGIGFVDTVMAGGAGKADEVGETGRQGIWFGVMLGIIGMLLMWLLVWPFQAWLSLSDKVENMMALYMFFTGLAMPAAMVHRALHAYASSLNRPRVIMIVSFLAFLLNIPLNYAFVYGKFGMPALGGAGCGVATAVVFWFNALVLWLYVAKQQYFRKFKLMDKFSKPDGRAFKQIWKLGMPIGLSFFLEVSLFSCIVFLVARLGEDYVAAQQVVISLTGVIYMIPQSVGAAGTVRVGYSLGRGEYVRARYVAGVSLVLGLLLAVLTALLLVLFRHPLAGMYTDDAGVLAIAATVLLFAAVFQLADAAQVIASGALRGYKITTAPMLIHTLSFWGIGLGLGLWLGLGQGTLPLGYGTRPLGAAGFWWALTLSLVLAAVLLVALLAKESRRGVRRQILLAEGGARGELATLRRGKP